MSDAPPFIAGFWGNISLENGMDDPALSYVEIDSTSNGDVFNKTKVHIGNLLYEGFGSYLTGFDPTHIFLVTWKNVLNNDPDSSVSYIFY